MVVTVEKPSQKTLADMLVFSWPIWEKEAGSFDWFYEEKETCFFLEGEVTITALNGEKTHIGKGDLVVFPKGLRCTWEIRSKVKKHYNFG